MASCKNRDAVAYWAENMKALGLDVPTSWFGSSGDLLSHIGAVVGAMQGIGAKARVRDLILKPDAGRTLVILGAVRAMFYAGAALGSLAVARGREMACGATIADVMWEIRQNGITPPAWLHDHLVRNPEILKRKNSSSGRIYYSKALN